MVEYMRGICVNNWRTIISSLEISLTVAIGTYIDLKKPKFRLYNSIKKI